MAGKDEWEGGPWWGTWLGIYLLLVSFSLIVLLIVFWPVRTLGNNWEQSVSLFGVTFIDVLSDETRLLIIVAVVGALGSFIHSASSFATYLGNRSLKESWLWWYLLRPCIGMALAVILFFVVRGGLLATGTDAADVSPFGVAAVAGMAGMFSKKTADKLQEVFENLLRTEKGDELRKDKLLEAAKVADVMVPANSMVVFTIPKGKAERDITIEQLYDKYQGIVTRLPVLDSTGIVLYIIHQSLLYRYIASKTIHPTGGQPPHVANDTLEDFLNSDMRDYVEKSLTFVPLSATVAEAKRKMDATKNCQDVFVTESGGSNEPVVGWLTNVAIANAVEN